MVTLNDFQKEAVSKMKNGCILCGGVGSGKSRTALAYYYISCGGKLWPEKTRITKPLDLYVITTAKKRDDLDWEHEMLPFVLDRYNISIKIDSWNNIKKYGNITGAFFIFDEQRAVSYGKWGKTFIRIARRNKWVMLSATPGDKWLDYMPVFIANGYFRDKRDFMQRHVALKPWMSYPVVDHYIDEGKLLKYRRDILVDLDDMRQTVRHDETIWVMYDREKYRDISRNRFDPWNQEPIQSASGLCYALRRVANSDESRFMAVLEICEDHPKVIIFYNFDYELGILKSLSYGPETVVAEWNGHRHERIPNSEKWVYLVQYTAGAEGWNCIQTNAMIFFSQTYSYKALEQSKGRIDRINTPYRDLYYYHLKTRSGIDMAISEALSEKRDFNERRWIGKESM